MSTGFVCPLCLKTCDVLKSPPQENRIWRQLYAVISKYFEDLYVETGCDLCLECWRENLNFYKFQLTVLEAHKKQRQLASDNRANNESEAQVTKNDVMPVDITSQRQDITPQEDEIAQQKNHFEPINTHPVNIKCQSSMPMNISTDNETEEYEDELPSVEVVLPIDNTGARDNFERSPQTLAQTNLYKGIKGPQKRAETSKVVQTKVVKPKLTTNFNNSMVKKKQYLECHRCLDSFSSITLLQRHFRRQHPVEKFYIFCCDQKLKWRWTIEEHMRIHLKKNTRVSRKHKTK